MTAITIGTATATLPAKAAVKPAAKAPAANGVLARLWASFIEARMRQAEREIALHRHLLPGQLQVAGERLARSEKDLPFFR